MGLLRYLICCALLSVNSGGLICAAQNPEPRMPVILSTDVGNEIDDQWTIAYLLLQPRFDVLGVMSAHAPTIYRRPPAIRLTGSSSKWSRIVWG